MVKGIFLIVDVQKNTMMVDLKTMDRMFSALPVEEVKSLLSESTIRHETMKELDKEIHGFIKDNRKGV